MTRFESSFLAPANATAVVLAELGSSAMEAIPTLRELLKGEDSQVSMCAAYAIQKINPEGGLV